MRSAKCEVRSAKSEETPSALSQPVRQRNVEHVENFVVEFRSVRQQPVNDRHEWRSSVTSVTSVTSMRSARVSQSDCPLRMGHPQIVLSVGLRTFLFCCCLLLFPLERRRRSTTTTRHSSTTLCYLKLGHGARTRTTRSRTKRTGENRYTRAPRGDGYAESLQHASSLARRVA